jgi:hypothetical protein
MSAPITDAILRRIELLLQPPMYARALVGLVGGRTAECAAIEILPGEERVYKHFKFERPGTYRVVMTQMGGVPVVLTGMHLGEPILLKGPSLGAEIVVRPEDTHLTLALSLEALWWPTPSSI